MDENYCYGFEKDRFLKKEIILEYVKQIECAITDGENGKILLDIGCGNGRFLIPLANRNPSLIIYGVDDSAIMIKSLLARIRNIALNNILPINRDFLSHEFGMTFDIVLASEVMHLLNPLDKVMSKIHSLLKPRGSFFIRTPLTDQLATGDMYYFFPEALEIDRKRHFSIKDLSKVAKETGLAIGNRINILESNCLECSEYFDLYERKIYSSLRLIPPQIFAKRLHSMKIRLRGQKCAQHSISMSLIKLYRNDA